MRSSHLPTACSSWRAPASVRSSSPVARSGTRKSSTRPTRPASPWCSRDGVISDICNMANHGIVILDYGSQFTQLIARRIRSKGVFSEILPWNTTRARALENHPRGIILSGGPASVFDADAPTLPADIWSWDVPVLAICYGMQLVSRDLGFDVVRGAKAEYGHTRIQADV